MVVKLVLRFLNLSLEKSHLESLFKMEMLTACFSEILGQKL